MASELTKTTESALVPEVWGPRLIKKLYDPDDITPRVTNATGDYKGVGDIAHIAVDATAWTVNNLGADGALTVQSNTMTDVSLTIDKEKEITVEIIKTLRRPGYSFQDRFNLFPESAGDALREQIVNDLLALYSDVTQSEGDGTGNVNEDHLLGAITQLGKQKLPILKKPDQFTFVFHHQQFKTMKKGGYLDFNRTGQAGMGGAASIGLPAVYNIPVVFTNQVATSASTIHENLLFHTSAFAWAAHRMPQFEQASGVGAGQLVDVLVMWALYGVKTVVAARAVNINTVTT